MRFKVREGFAVHISRLVEIPGLGGEVVTELQNSSHYAGQVAEISADEAIDHLHKLEPFDKEALAWLKARAVVVADPVPAAASALDANTLATVVAAAVAQALAAQAAQASSAAASTNAGTDQPAS
jgi:hypothetical protein